VEGAGRFAVGAPVLDSVSRLATGTLTGGAGARGGTAGSDGVAGTTTAGDSGGTCERAAVVPTVTAAVDRDGAGATATLIGRRLPRVGARREMKPHEGCHAPLRRVWIAARCNVPNMLSDGTYPGSAANFSCR
jgi:hypothetical protein